MYYLSATRARSNSKFVSAHYRVYKPLICQSIDCYDNQSGIHFKDLLIYLNKRLQGIYPAIHVGNPFEFGCTIPQLHDNWYLSIAKVTMIDEFKKMKTTTCVDQ